jgi:hypothetical protein
MDEMLFPEEALAMLQQARYDPEARRGYEALTCAFYWSDELLSKVHRICLNHGSRAYFYLMVFRSSHVRSKPIEEYRRTWEQLQAAAPEWPGFRPERCSTDIARDLDRTTKRQCIALERELREVVEGENHAEPLDTTDDPSD